MITFPFVTKGSARFLNLVTVRQGFPWWLRRWRICPRCRRTRVRSLGQDDPLEKGMATHPSVLAWSLPWTDNLVGYSPRGGKELDTTEWLIQWDNEAMLPGIWGLFIWTLCYLVQRKYLKTNIHGSPKPAFPEILRTRGKAAFRATLSFHWFMGYLLATLCWVIYRSL